MKTQKQGFAFKSSNYMNNIITGNIWLHYDFAFYNYQNRQHLL